MLISLYDSPNTIRPQSDKSNYRPDFFASNFLRYSSKTAASRRASLISAARALRFFARSFSSSVV